MLLTEQRRHLRLHVADVAGVGHLDHDLVDRRGAEQAHLTRLERDHEGVVLVATGPG